MAFYKGLTLVVSILLLAPYFTLCDEVKPVRLGAVGDEAKATNMTKSTSSELGPLHGLEEENSAEHKIHEPSMGMGMEIGLGGKVASEESSMEHDKKMNPEAEPRSNSSSVASRMPMPIMPEENKDKKEEAPMKILPSRFNQPQPQLRPPTQQRVSPTTPTQLLIHSDESVHEHVERYQLHQAEDDSSDSAELALKNKNDNKKPIVSSLSHDAVVLTSESIPVRVGPNTRLGSGAPGLNRNPGNVAVRRPLPILRRDQLDNQQQQQQPSLPFNQNAPSSSSSGDLDPGHF